MPYIPKKERVELNDAILELMTAIAELDPEKPDWEKRAGRLNYVITRLCCGSFELDKNPKYHKINTVIGALECVKLEMYRRLAAIYENKKIEEYGDVVEYEQFTDLSKTAEKSSRMVI